MACYYCDGTGIQVGGETCIHCNGKGEEPAQSDAPSVEEFIKGFVSKEKLLRISESDFIFDTICEISEAYAALRTAQLRHDLMNLLAGIHRDGGHYAGENGIHKASEEAAKIVLAERSKSAQLERELASERVSSGVYHAGIRSALRIPTESPIQNLIYAAQVVMAKLDKAESALSEARERINELEQHGVGDHLNWQIARGIVCGECCARIKTGEKHECPTSSASAKGE